MDCRLSLRVIRQQRSILSQSHELAVCIRNEDDSFNLIYKDRSYTGCTLSEIATAVEVNAKSIGKAFVLHAVGRDIFELRAKLPDYSMFFAKFIGFYEAAQRIELLDPMAVVAAKTKSSATLLEVSASKMLASFTRGVAKVVTKDRAEATRFSNMTKNIAPYITSSEPMRPSGWMKGAIDVEGLKIIDLKCDGVRKEVDSLCVAKELEPLTGFTLSHASHYGKYDDGKLVTFMSLSVMKLNSTPGSIAVSVDMAASIDKTHSMSLAVESIKKTLRKRRAKCVLFAQVARTKSARAFWGGRLTRTRRSSVISALFSEFDNRYKIFADADDMAIFYE